MTTTLTWIMALNGMTKKDFRTLRGPICKEFPDTKDCGIFPELYCTDYLHPFDPPHYMHNQASNLKYEKDIVGWDCDPAFVCAFESSYEENNKNKSVLYLVEESYVYTAEKVKPIKNNSFAEIDCAYQIIDGTSYLDIPLEDERLIRCRVVDFPVSVDDAFFIKGIARFDTMVYDIGFPYSFNGETKKYNSEDSFKKNPWAKEMLNHITLF